MPRIWKRIKKYERWVLLGIVIVVLATFSVSSQCQPDGSRSRIAGAAALGGSYEAAQGRRERVEGEEFVKVRERYRRVHGVQAWGPTLRWADEFLAADPRKDRLNDDMATWAHIATVGAARAAGYEVSDDETRAGVRRMIERAAQGRDGRGGQAFSPELYERALAVFQINRTEFEKTVAEILLKDKFLAPLIDGTRFAVDREEAFEAWKAEKERLDLEFAAVPAAQFEGRVSLQEQTRSTIGGQRNVFERLVLATQDIRRVASVVDTARAAAGGTLPKDEAELLASEVGKRSLAAGMPRDPWGKPAKTPSSAGSSTDTPTVAEKFRTYGYKVVGDTYTVSSVGPDGVEGTADDVDRSTAAIVETLASLRRTADALLLWRAAAGSWPTALADLTKPPPPAEGQRAAPPPLSAVAKDAFDREFVYEAAGPLLLSLGQDGQRGTADDLATTLTPDRALVPVPGALSAFVDAGLKDGWGTPFQLQLGQANPVSFEVRSAGPDLKFAAANDATADDVVDSNEIEILTFYNRVRLDYRVPEKRVFEALYAIPCLVPDAIFAAAWKAFPEFRPSDADAFDWFRAGRGSFYVTSKKGSAADGEGGDAKDVDVDPADIKEGNGAALVEALRGSGAIPRDGKVQLVPGPEAFGDQKDPPAPKAGQPDPMGDPIWKNFVDKGWRRVVLRDQFFEKLINDVLSKCRVASEARTAWEKSGKTGPEPAAVTFAGSMERFKDFQPSQADQTAGARFVDYFAVKPDAPLSREEWEKLPELGDVNTSEALKRLKGDEYASIPTLLRVGTIHAAFHGIRIDASREQEIDEVREKLFPAYLEARALDRAASELDAVAVKLKVKDAVFADVLAAAGKERDFTYTLGRTGRFIGSLGARRALVADPTASDDAKAEIRRRNYVRSYGYDAVKASGSRQDPTSSTLGTVGRRVLRDDSKEADSTRSAYIVRVAWAEDPSRDEFDGKEFATHVTNSTGVGNIYANQGRISERRGTVAKQLARMFDDWDAIRQLFVIETNSNIVLGGAKKAP